MLIFNLKINILIISVQNNFYILNNFARENSNYKMADKFVNQCLLILTICLFIQILSYYFF